MNLIKLTEVNRMNIVAHNMFAMNASRQLNITNKNKAKNTEKLSSGYRINRASDDAAGLSISEKMRRQIRGLSQGVRNTQDGVSVCQVADGALAEVSEMLHRMTELSVQSANGTNSDTDRQAIQQEISQIKQEIGRIGDTTEFNTRKLFTGQIGTTVIPAVCEPCTSSNLSVSGSPADTTAMKYSMSANTAGFSINSDKFAWSDFKSGSNTLNDVPIAGGTYTFDYHGFTLSLTVDNNAKKEDIIGKLDGASFATKADPIQYVNKIDTISASGKVACKTPLPDDYKVSIHLEKKSDGLYGCLSYNGMLGTAEKITPYRTDTGRSWIHFGGNENGTIYQISDANPFDGGVSVQVNFKAPCTDDDVYNTLNGATLKLEYNTSLGGGDNNGYYIKGIKANSSQIVVPSAPVLSEINQTDYNGKVIKPAQTLYSDKDLSLWIQSGCEEGDGMFLEIDRMNTTILGIKDVDVSTADGATKALDVVSGALEKVSANRSKIGAQQNRLEHTIANENNVVENTTAAESRIRDADIAKEMVEFSKNMILDNVGQAMLAQANKSNEGVLSLLQ